MYSEQSKQLQIDLESVIKLSNDNNMKLHEQKFELVVHRANPGLLLHQLPFTSDTWTYSISDEQMLSPVEELRDLGVLVTEKLSWSLNIHSLIVKTTAMASWVLSVFKSRDRLVMLTLYKSLVRSHIEYCCPLWHPNKISEIQRLESIQRSFTARILDVNHLNYWDRLKALQLLSLQRRRERYILLHMWKILYKACPNEMNVEFRSISRLGLQALVPGINRTSTSANQTLYENSFAVVGPRLWNVLPKRLALMDSESRFKFNLTDYLMTLPDEPPVHGYARSHNNTLPEVARMFDRRSPEVMA